MKTRFASRELFRYTRVKPFAIVDVAARARRSERYASVLAMSESDRIAWAESYVKSAPLIRSLRALQTDPLLKADDALLSRTFLPSLEELGCDMEPPRLAGQPEYRDDLDRALGSVLAFKLLGRTEDAEKAGRILQILERLPHPDPKGRRRFAPTVLHRYQAPRDRHASEKRDRCAEPSGTDRSLAGSSTPRDTSAAVQLLWRAKSAELKTRKLAMQENLRRNSNDSERQPRRRAHRSESEAKEAAARYFEELRARKRNLAEEHKTMRALEARFTLADALDDSAEALAGYAKGADAEAIAKAQRQVRDMMTRYTFPPQEFCQAIEEFEAERDKHPPKKKADTLLDGRCFSEHPHISFDTRLRVLGHADLIRVDETFMRYTEGELSYVENILAGEVRKREIKNTKYFETLTEQIARESSSLTEETSSTVSQDLASQVDSELRTRMQSDVDASGSASGGGSIGVVDFQGSGSLSAAFGVGVDTSLATSTRSEFSQEIINRSIENTKKSTIQRRIDRSYTLFETADSHEINNTVGDSITHRRGLYAFLDKQVCLSETVYGKRLFLMADVLAPGRNLLCEQHARMALREFEAGQRPEFDISPDDIQPSTYKSLTARFQATNVKPPPEPLIRLARTYKTDQTNLTKEEPGGQKFKNLVDFMVPFFERYNRYVVTDTIKLPDGYEVLGTTVTVNHGSNGISIPAHLPLTAAGAVMYAGPTLLYSALLPHLYLPLTIWQLAYMASPLLHYNTDSSNVTVCVGNESQDSQYFFFAPEVLLHELVEFISSFAALTPDLLGQIQAMAQELVDEMVAKAQEIPAVLATDVQAAVDSLVAKIKTVFDRIIAALDPTTGEAVPTFGDPNGELFRIAQAIDSLAAGITVSLGQLATSMGELFTPVQDFVTSVFSLIGQGVENAISDFLSIFLQMFENSQVLRFAEAFGTRKELAFSLNAVALHPAVTVNFTACLHRTEEALDQWRLDTFGALYNAYLRQLAEYEGRAYSGGAREVQRSPGGMRQEERLAMKELVLHALNNLHGPEGNSYTLDRINLFEHAIDWENVSYRLYNYGPSLALAEAEARGYFRGVDAKRKAFLTAHWAQVMLPLRADPRLEHAMLHYIESGEADLDKEVAQEELAALYQDLVLERSIIDESPEVTHRTEIVPTDFVVLIPDDTLPENPQTPCTQAGGSHQ